MASASERVPGAAGAAVRAFLAILVPSAAELLETLRTDADLQSLPVRWLLPEGLHVTLAFLGESPSRQLATAWPGIAEAIAGGRPAPLALQRPEPFPDAQRPRLIVAPILDGRGLLQELQAALVDTLADNGYALEDRTFRPHVSLGRLRPPLLRGQPAAIAGALRNVEWPGATSFTAQSVCLMRSDLFPDGARYTVLAEAKLGRVR